MPEPQRTPTASALAQALQLTHDGLGVFQRLQEQTAQLHRQFLQSQETAQQTLTKLIEQHQQLLLASIGAAPVPAVQPIAIAPAPDPGEHGPSVVARSPDRATAADRRSPDFQGDLRSARVVGSGDPTTTRAIPGDDGGDKPRRSPAVVTASAGRDHVKQVLLEVVAEKTGYPAEMLDPAMGLDADLGIDSIKRVEILSTLQERLPEAPAVKPEHLGTLHTLDQIIDFLSAESSERPGLPPPSSGAADGKDKPRRSPGRERVQQVLLEVVADKTGYPAEMLNPSMGLDADLGIDSIKRVEILSAIQERLPEAPAVKPEHLGTLNTLDHIIDFLANGATSAEDAKPQAAASPIRRQTLRSDPLPFEQDRPVLRLPAGATVALVGGADALADHLAEQVRAHGIDVRRFYWDSPVEIPVDVGGLILLAAPQANLNMLAAGFRWLHACGPALIKSGKSGGALFATVSRLDGAFGLGRIESDNSALAGGLAGMAKTAHHEWPEVACKAIDVDPSLAPDSMARELADELFRVGPTEIGIGANGRVALTLVEQSSPPIDRGLLGSSDVVVITGGARGVTAECAVAFAEAYRPTLVLLGRSPLAGNEPDWLRGLRDEREIKAAASAREKLTPKQANRRYAEIAAQREVLANLERIIGTGARVTYRNVDVRDANAVASVIAQMRDQFGPITGIVHGAGVIEDKLILEKTDDQFERVVGTKVEGLLNLLAATEGDPLKVLALFSSSTGRFGRKGQADYAVGNEVLNKLARREAAKRPGCRVVAVNWGPWEGGMVTPKLQQLFEREGVGMIPLKAGAQFLLAELSATSAPIEVVAGVWLDHVRGAEGDGSKAPDSRSHAPHGTEVGAGSSGPASDISMTSVWQRDIDLASTPILAAHVIDGKAVVPLALHVEWLVHAAMHGNPGFAFQGLDDVRVLTGIKLSDDRPAAVSAFAGKAQKRDGVFVVPVELRGKRGDGRDVGYSRADVVLANALATNSPHIAVPNLRSYPHSIDHAYRRVLFHGAQFRAITAVEGIGDDSIVAMVRTAPPPSAWLREPPRQNWLADPLALDAAFQLLILWGVEKRGEPNLPAGFARYRQFRRAFPSGEVRVLARITGVSGPIIRADVEWLDAGGTPVALMEQAEFVGDAKLAAAFRRNSLPAAVG